MNIEEILSYAINNRASDIHLIAGNPPAFRISGHLMQSKSMVLTKENILEVLKILLTDADLAKFYENLELDFAFEKVENRFRGNAFNSLRGPGLIMRHIPSKIFTMDELNLPQSIKGLVNLTQGLVLVTGVTGSGKSTTLASLINHINEHHQKHILTIEDPIEFVHQSKKSIVNQREVGKHSKSYADALKSALREDLDVVLIGEMRDLETIELAITIAETGHLVFGTLHSSSAAQTIDRLVGVFPGNEKEMIMKMLSTSIDSVISQKLVRKKDGSGMVAAHEVMKATPGIRNLIRENKISQIDSMLQIGSKYGMKTMKDSLQELVKGGVISNETAALAVNDLGDQSAPAGGTTQAPLGGATPKPSGNSDF